MASDLWPVLHRSILLLEVLDPRAEVLVAGKLLPCLDELLPVKAADPLPARLIGLEPEFVGVCEPT